MLVFKGCFGAFNLLPHLTANSKIQQNQRCTYYVCKCSTFPFWLQVNTTDLLTMLCQKMSTKTIFPQLYQSLFL